MVDEFVEPPPGWFTFGTHLDFPDVPLQFSKETGEDGLPLWERPVITVQEEIDRSRGDRRG